MGEEYFNLKYKLEELGYNNTLPLDAVPLVECIVADLLQTTRSLQHYMNLSKDVLVERDSLILAAEPYKRDNIRLIQENNKLHQDNILLQEQNVKLKKELKHKIKNLTVEIQQKDSLITKLQHDVRDLNLRGLCADTLSSRNKSKKRDGIDNNVPKQCVCKGEVNYNENEIPDLKRHIQSLQNQIEENIDEIQLLKDQIRNRDAEIVRLKILLEGGTYIKSIPKDFEENKSECKLRNKEIKDLLTINESLKKEMERNLEKQHEAMLRALELADKNKILQEEIEKVDRLALNVEAECNKKIQTMTNEAIVMQNRIKTLHSEITRLEHELKNKYEYNMSKENEVIINNSVKEKPSLQEQVNNLMELTKNLQEKMYFISEVITKFHLKLTNGNEYNNQQINSNKLFKDELQEILEEERNKYEICLSKLQEKLNETMKVINKNVEDKNTFQETSENLFVRGLQVKLCEEEQKNNYLKKEIDVLKSKINDKEDCDKSKHKEVIRHLNLENTELSKENIFLSQQLSHYKSLNLKSYDRGDCCVSVSCQEHIQKLNKKVIEMENEIQLLQKDKLEYMSRYKESMAKVEKFKRDLLLKQKDVEDLEEENCSYKMTSRTERVTSQHIKEECNLLKDQLKQLQNEIMREKTVTSQIKNIQIETERSNNVIQNELLTVQKKLSLSNDTIKTLEIKCEQLQSEIVAFKHEKSNLLASIKTIDEERDNLVIELDNKTENMSILEQKLKSQSFEISKLQNEVLDLNRKLSMTHIAEHKVADYESQIKFLNQEILQLTKQYDIAVIENKHMQNNLADVNALLKITKIDFEKSKRDVDSLKQQLQHYVCEIRRIEELLSEKEAERSDMLEQFASLSVEANILENTNHSLESESASKSLQLQTYINKIKDLENKISDKDNIIDSQSARIAAITCKITTLENDLKHMTEEKSILEQNILHLKQKCNNMQENKTIFKNVHDRELELTFENKIKFLTHVKDSMQTENDELKRKLNDAEKLLSNARKEVVDLKLALQDAIDQNKNLQELVNSLKKQESFLNEKMLSNEELELSQIDDKIDEASIDERSEQSDKFDTIHYKYGHSSTM